MRFTLTKDVMALGLAVFLIRAILDVFEGRNPLQIPGGAAVIGLLILLVIVPLALIGDFIVSFGAPPDDEKK
ncbi:MAG: hypothetical protein K2Q10_03010 [Rhodospirillales bacterium]|nr:hypothetical protein [Rhodospirillales bacterium]